MTNRQRFIAPALLLAALLLVAVTQPGLAQGKQAASIVVIDTQEIYRESSAVKQLQEHINQQRTAYQDDIRKKEDDLRKDDQELQKQRALLSNEGYVEKRRELEEKLTTLQREVQVRKRGLEKLFAEGMNRVRRTLVEISQDIAKARDADLVIEKSAVVLVKPELEITKEVLAGLNKKLPSIDIASLKN